MDTDAPRSEKERFTRKLTCDVVHYFDIANIPYALHPSDYTPCTYIACPERSIDRVGWSNPDIDRVLSWKTRYHSVPSAHFHFRLDDNPFACLLSLHSQLSLLWWLPEIPPGLPPPNDPVFMLSWDARPPPFSNEGGSGPWSGPKDKPVKILTLDVVATVVILLWCRDSALGWRLADVWFVMLGELGDGPEGAHAKVTKKLRASFQHAWDCAHRRRAVSLGKSPWQAFCDLRDRLAESGQLGPLVDPRDCRRPELEKDRELSDD
ncbi:hypothetical protein BDW74DRAFT_175243 [Aspergillus multicolor]|uniref:uncharacterized protein n=1 Tax=Aspergillus multicolor TaxID=41759 RepID=UPI003CCD7C72